MLNREFNVNRPIDIGLVIQLDIPTKGGWLYLTMIMEELVEKLLNENNLEAKVTKGVCEVVEKTPANSPQRAATSSADKSAISR